MAIAALFFWIGLFKYPEADRNLQYAIENIQSFEGAVADYEY